MLELSSLEDDELLDCCGRPVTFGSGDAGVPAVVEVAMLQGSERAVSPEDDGERMTHPSAGLAAAERSRSTSHLRRCV